MLPCTHKKKVWFRLPLPHSHIPTFLPSRLAKFHLSVPGFQAPSSKLFHVSSPASNFKRSPTCPIPIPYLYPSPPTTPTPTPTDLSPPIPPIPPIPSWGPVPLPFPSLALGRDEKKIHRRITKPLARVAAWRRCACERRKLHRTKLEADSHFFVVRFRFGFLGEGAGGNGEWSKESGSGVGGVGSGD